MTCSRKYIFFCYRKQNITIGLMVVVNGGSLSSYLKKAAMEFLLKTRK